MIDKSQDVILFFTPEARVVPHYVAQCVLAKTLQEQGYQVLLACCFEDFSRCPVMDMMFAPYDFSGSAKSKLCGDCHSIAEQLLQHYCLKGIDLKSFVTQEIRTQVAEAIKNAPEDLRRFVFDGVHFGKLVASDLVLGTKCSKFEKMEDRFRNAWLRYIESSMLSYLIVQAMSESYPIKRIAYHNEYGLNLGARLAGRKLGIPVLTVTHASHLNVDRRRYVIEPEILHRAYDRVIEGWESWRNLTLSADEVHAVGDDILYRLGAQGSHVYSPAKTVKQTELFERLRLSRERKLIVAFTSSLDEYLARTMVFEGMEVTGLRLGGPFLDQLDWLTQLTAFIERRIDLQLVVRVHPREGANKRENTVSQHLHCLKAAFEREIPNCRFIWPEDPTSSYDLIEIADLVLTSWTTVGLEAARLGVPVLKAFGNYAYPDDDFLHWVPAVDEYFEKLTHLCSAPASEETILRAFRSHHALKLASSLDLSDIIPTFNFESVPAFRMPKEAASIEEIIVGLKSPKEINRARLRAVQSLARTAEEKQELRRQLRRIIHFLHTGRDQEPTPELWHRPAQAQFESAPISPALKAAARWIDCEGPRTRYWEGTAKYERYSPLAARLAPLCAVAPPLAVSAKETENGSMGPENRTELPHVKIASARPSGTKILFVNTYYPQFLESHYRQNPELESAPYSRQLDSLVNACFGDSDFYSHPLNSIGWEAGDLVVNCPRLQQAWAKENGLSGAGIEVALEQIRRKRPQVVYLQDLSLATSQFLSAIRPHTEIIVGQIACPLPAQADLAKLDLVFSSFPHFVDRFRAKGVTAHYLPLAFDPRILTKQPQGERNLPVTFIGGVSPAHGKGSQFLEEVARAVPVDFWGYGAETLAENSPIRSRHHGEVWGKEMFALFRRSRLTLNRHIDVAENYANNMRLFEATGCGALLLTDYKDNLSELFEIDQEVVTYRSPEECWALIRYYLAHPEEAEAIARAGQQRTLRDHTYARRMEKIAEILERQLRYKREAKRYGPVDLSKISRGYAPITAKEITPALTTAWKNPDLPARQRALVQQELGQMAKGLAPVVYRVLGDALRPLTKPGGSVLEIGCSSGYYYEAIEYLLKRPIAYTGVDYSDAMIAMAGDYYPKAKFQVADGAHLPFGDGQFEVAISSCILLHVPNYAEHIVETARVAKRFVVAHRTPVCRQRPTQYLTKLAYGIQTVEIRFDEKELIALFARSGLELVNALEYYSQPERDEFELTYVFAKKANARVRPVPARFVGAVDGKPLATGRPLAAAPNVVGAAAPPSNDLRKATRDILKLFTEMGVNPVKACLEGIWDNEKLTRAAEKLVQDFLTDASSREAVQAKLQFIQARAEGNFRFYLQPQLEKFFLWLLESSETTNYTYDIDPLNKEYLASTVALVTRKPVREIEGFLEEICASRALRGHIREWILRSPQRFVCDLNVQFGRRIGWYAFVRALKPKVVVETGVEKGMGTCVIAQALMRNEQEGFPGLSYGTDIDPNAGFLVQGAYAKYGKILYGDSIETLKKFSHSIDLFINDSAHSQEYERQEYATVKEKLAENAVILGDDSHNSNELRRFAMATGREFLFFAEKPLGHWYPGAGIGIAFKRL